MEGIDLATVKDLMGHAEMQMTMVSSMFIIYLADIPKREIRAEEIRHCSNCKKDAKHRYEEVSFHAQALFVNIFCYKKRFVRICSECNFGVEMEEEEFKREVARLIFPIVPRYQASKKPPEPSRYDVSKTKGIRYCHQCGERIFPDLGYCTSCAVRKPPVDSKKKASPKKASSAPGKYRAVQRPSSGKKRTRRPSQ